MKKLLLVVAVTVLLPTCKQEGAAEPAPSTAASAVESPAPASSSASPNPGGATLAVPEDFEDEAKKTVTADTLNSELDKLEKTIASAPAK
jgi:hypothetical protein